MSDNASPASKNASSLARSRALGRPRFALAVLLSGVVGHALLVGLPIALIVRRSARA